MIPKVSSSELNDILIDSKKKLDSLSVDFSDTKKNIEKKLKIINYENEYLNKKLMDFNNGGYVNKKNTIICSNNFINEISHFDQYGNTVHAELIKTPINVFNLEVSALNEFYFREDVSVTVNDKNAEVNLSILKHDMLNKEIFFNEYSNNKIKIEITLNDLSSYFGSTRFNCIEIDPFLQGSFDIDNIEIYEFKDDGTVDTSIEPTIYSGIIDVGKERIVLDRKMKFYKVVFNITINYSTIKNEEEVFPFGIKHIYFYDMDFKNSSYITATITSDNYIAYIKNRFEVLSPFGRTSNKLDNTNIRLYLDKEGDTLYNEIEPSDDDEAQEIARNVKTIYAKIPLAETESIIGLTFDIIKRAE